MDLQPHKVPLNNFWWDIQNKWFLRFLPSSSNQLIILGVCVLYESLFQHFLFSVMLVARDANLPRHMPCFPDWQQRTASVRIRLTSVSLSLWTVTLSLRVSMWRSLSITHEFAKSFPRLLSISFPLSFLVLTLPSLFSILPYPNTFSWKDLVISSHFDL